MRAWNLACLVCLLFEVGRRGGGHLSNFGNHLLDHLHHLLTKMTRNLVPPK